MQLRVCFFLDILLSCDYCGVLFMCWYLCVVFDAVFVVLRVVVWLWVIVLGISLVIIHESY